MINKEEILDRTNRGLDVFKYYLRIDFRPGKNFKNPLYDDKNASCNIYFDRHSRTFKMKDFGDESYSGDCFWFVATIKGWNVKSDFSNIVSLINSDLNLNLAPSTTGTYTTTTAKTTTVSKEDISPNIAVEKNTSSFKVESKQFTSTELGYWQKYGIKLSTLKLYHVTSVKSYESINRNNEPFKIESSDLDPIFAYNGNGYVKLYRPLNNKMRFLYGGEMPEVYCFGLEQLPNKGDIVFITGGEKDVMSLYSKGFFAVCFNSETDLFQQP